MRELAQYALLGAGTAALYVWVAHGILIVHRGSGILNFAQGAYVMVGAYLFDDIRSRGMPLVPAMTLTALAVGAIGAVSYAAVVRPLSGSALVTRIVATLGIVIVLTEMVNVLWPTAILVETILPLDPVHFAGVEVSQDRLILLAMAAVLGALLWALYRFTTFGLATAAVSENKRAAAALGWSPDTIATASWFMAGASAGIAALFIAPVQPSLNSVNLVLLVVPALAVALVARFRSFPVAVLAGFALASAQQYLSGTLIAEHPALKGAEQLLPLAAIVAILVIGGDRLPTRGQRAEHRPMLGTGLLKPLPVLVVAGVVLIGIWTVLPADWVAAVTTQATFALLALSLVVVLGYAGQLSLGQVAFAGIAALVAGRLVATQGWSFGPAMFVGIVAAAAAGALFALPALRTCGLALGIVTLALGVAMHSLLFTRAYYSPPVKSAAGLDLSFGVSQSETVVGKVSMFGIGLNRFEHPQTYATFCILVLVALTMAVATLRRGRAGRRLIAVRTNERAAASIGINVAAAKIYAFTLSAAIAGFSGVLLSFREGVISYSNDYNPIQSVYAVAFAVVGGIGFVTGAVLGALLFPASMGAAMGRDFSDWLADVGAPRPWISALLLMLMFQPLIMVVGRRIARGGRGITAVATVALIAVGALLSDSIGHMLGSIDDRVPLAPWIGALVVGALLSAIAKAVAQRGPFKAVPRWVPLAVLVVATVLARMLAKDTVARWMTNLSDYLPVVGGVGLIVMMLQHGDGLASTAAHTVRLLTNAGNVRTNPALPTVSDSADEEAERRGGTLEVRNLTVSFGGVVAVDGFSFELQPGEIVGLIGPNGAGKSTVVDAVTGYAQLDIGEIDLDGVPLDGLPAHRRTRLGVTRTFQNLELFDDLTVLENVAAASDPHDVGAYATNLIRPGRLVLSGMAANAVREFNLQDELDTQVRNLPHGRRRLVAVARAVATRPSVLLLDEPAAGLDDAERVEFAALVRDLSTRWGLSLLVIEHDMGFIMSLCDRIVVMDFGRKIAEGTPQDVQTNPAVIAAYLGDDENAEELERHAANVLAETEDTKNHSATSTAP
jgi:sulfate-transporting ATPase